MTAREFLLTDPKIEEAVSNGYDIRLKEHEVIEKMELYSLKKQKLNSIKVHVIVTLDEGIINDPDVFISQDEAGKEFEDQVVGQGFREKEANETWQHYVEAFQSWEDTSECKYDKMDWEIHWYENIDVK